MRKYLAPVIAAAGAALLIATFAVAQPGVGFSRSADFAGTGSSGSPMEMSAVVTLPGTLAVAGNAGLGDSALIDAHVILGSTAVTSTAFDTLTASYSGTTQTVNRVASSGLNNGTFNTTAGPLFAWGVAGRSEATRSSGANSLINVGVYGSASGAQANYSFFGIQGTLYNSAATQLDSTLLVNDDATFESGTCVINSAGITCSGTLLTPGADITAVNAGTSLTGGGSSGSVTLNVALPGATCAASEAVTAISSAGTGTCTTVGDITSVGATANMGLTGGATSGAATLGLLSTCANDQVLKSAGSGTSWVCADDETGGAGAGDIEGVTAGNGLTGGGNVGTVTLDVACGAGLSCNANDVTLNLAGASCSAGSFVSAISSTGTGTCTADTDPSYTAGDGLTLTALDFDIIYTSDFTITADQLDLSTAVTMPGSATVATTLAVTGGASASHFYGTGADPTASSCGTSPTITATSENIAGEVDPGGGATSCTIDFGVAFGKAPWCLVTPGSVLAAGLPVPYVSARATGSFTFQLNGGGSMAEGTWTWHCLADGD